MNDFELGEISEFIYFLADNAKHITMSGYGWLHILRM
jgi:hypothetical protein